MTSGLQQQILISIEQNNEKELLDLYEQLKQGKSETTTSKPEINISSSLSQLTASFLEEKICKTKGSIKGFIKVITYYS